MRKRETTEQIGIYGLGGRSERGDRIVDFKNSKSMAVINTYLRKQLSRLATYHSEEKNMQVDYICVEEESKRLLCLTKSDRSKTT